MYFYHVWTCVQDQCVLWDINEYRCSLLWKLFTALCVVFRRVLASVSQHLWFQGVACFLFHGDFDFEVVLCVPWWFDFEVPSHVDRWAFWLLRGSEAVLSILLWFCFRVALHVLRWSFGFLVCLIRFEAVLSVPWWSWFRGASHVSMRFFQLLDAFDAEAVIFVPWWFWFHSGSSNQSFTRPANDFLK